MNTRKIKNTKTECAASPYSHSCYSYRDLDDDSLKSESIDRREKYYAWKPTLASLKTAK